MNATTTTTALRSGAVLLVALLAACGGEHAGAPPQVPTVTLPVTVATLEPLPSSEMAEGTVEADDRVQLSARTAGTVRAPGLHEGQAVRRGQLLLTIDARQADGAVARAGAALQAALAEQANADSDVARDGALARSGAIADEVLLKEQLRARLAASAAEQARAGLAIATAERSYNSLISPVDGIVVARHVRDGDTALPGMPLLTIESGKQLVFRFAIPQSGMTGFANGATVPVLLDGSEDRPVAGRVRAVVRSADPATRRYTVELTLPSGPHILPGMFGRVALPGAPGQNQAVTVPAPAIAERGGLSGVFVVNRERRLEFRWLRLGQRSADRVVVTAGLAAGETILARVDTTVRDGARLVAGAVR